MKKILYTGLFILAATLGAQAQGPWDAFRYSQQFYEGTARSLALGNAVTALGGDFGAMVLNPAASALYPYSEVTFSMALGATDVTSDYLNRTVSENKNKLTVPSFGYVGSSDGFTFAIGASRVNDYTHYARMGGFTKASWLSPLAAQTAGIPSTDLERNGDYNPYSQSNASWSSILAWNAYLLDLLPGTTDQYIAATENELDGEIFVPTELEQQFYRQSTGGATDYLLNLGFNVNRRVFLGFGISLQSLNYHYKERFVEYTQHPDLFQAPLQSYEHQYSLNTSGSGVKLSAGAIFLLGQGGRIGVGLTSPTWLQLNDRWSEEISAHFEAKTETARSPVGEYDYRLRTPWRMNLGFAYTFGNYGFVSIDYEGVNYAGMRLSAKNDAWRFEQENQEIRSREGFSMANNLRMGAELRVTDVAFRAGYSYYGSAHSSVEECHVVSCGLGYRSASSFFADLGLSYRMDGEEGFALYDNVEGIQAPRGSMGTNRTKVMLTLGLRF